MKYKAIPPTIPGFYIVRRVGETDPRHLVQVFKTFDGKLMVDYRDGNQPLNIERLHPLEWLYID